MLLPLSAHATVVKQDGRFIYEITPLTQMMSDNNQLALVMETSTRVLSKLVSEMSEKGLIPEDIETIDDIRQLERTNREIESQLDTLNGWIRASKQRTPFFNKWDLVPDAFMVFVGGKISGGLGLSKGVSLTIAAVIMPVHIRQYDKISGEITERVSFPVSLVALGAPQFGGGIGGGLSARVGVGLIWGNTKLFVDPAQFKGPGAGLAGSFMTPMPIPFLGGGMSWKLGALINDMHGRPNINLTYAMLSLDAGVAAGAEIHVNATMVMPLSGLLHHFYSAGEAYVRIQERNIARELENFYLENNDGGPISRPSGNAGGGNSNSNDSSDRVSLPRIPRN